MTTPLLLLRAAQLGVAIRDLELLTVGMVIDMGVENANDGYNFPLKATQADFDRF